MSRLQKYLEDTPSEGMVQSLEEKLEEVVVLGERQMRRVGKRLRFRRQQT